MTTIAVLADPPREGLVLPGLSETPLSASEIVDLYVASLSDVVRAVVDSGGELLVNYRPDDLIPAEYHGDRSAEAEVRAVVQQAVDQDVRYEVQVGSTPAARVGNTVTHLLETEEVVSAAVVPASAGLIGRTHIDGAAMKLRRSEVVLGPAPCGRTYYAGFADTIDFEDADEPPELETLTIRSLDAGHAVDYLAMLPTLETEHELLSAVSLVRSRAAAGIPGPSATTAAIDELGLRVVEVNGTRTLRRD